MHLLVSMIESNGWCSVSPSSFLFIFRIPPLCNFDCQICPSFLTTELIKRCIQFDLDFDVHILPRWLDLKDGMLYDAQKKRKWYCWHVIPCNSHHHKMEMKEKPKPPTWGTCMSRNPRPCMFL